MKPAKLSAAGGARTGWLEAFMNRLLSKPLAGGEGSQIRNNIVDNNNNTGCGIETEDGEMVIDNTVNDNGHVECGYGIECSNSDDDDTEYPASSPAPAHRERSLC